MPVPGPRGDARIRPRRPWCVVIEPAGPTELEVTVEYRGTQETHYATRIVATKESGAHRVKDKAVDQLPRYCPGARSGGEGARHRESAARVSELAFYLDLLEGRGQDHRRARVAPTTMANRVTKTNNTARSMARATTITTAPEACWSEPVPRRGSSRTGKAYHAAGRTFVVVASLLRRAYHCRRPGRSVATVNPAWSTPSPGAHGDGSREASHVAVPAVTVIVHRQRVPSSQARRSGPRGMSRPDAAPTMPSSR
jgi:hypothetical protein